MIIHSIKSCTADSLICLVSAILSISVDGRQRQVVLSLKFQESLIIIQFASKSKAKLEQRNRNLIRLESLNTE